METQNYGEKDNEEKDNYSEIDRENERITSQVSDFINELKKEIQSAKKSPDQKLFSFFDRVENMQASQEEKEFYQNILFGAYEYLKDGELTRYEFGKIDGEIDFELQKYNIIQELKDTQHYLTGIKDVHQKILFLNQEHEKNIKMYESAFEFPNPRLQKFYSLILMKLFVLKDKNNLLNPEKMQDFKSQMNTFKYLFEQSLSPEREKYDELFDDFFLQMNILILSSTDSSEVGLQFLVIQEKLFTTRMGDIKVTQYNELFLEMYEHAKQGTFGVQDIAYFKEKFKKLSQQII